MKKVLTLLLTLTVLLLSFGFASCGETEMEETAEPYVIATVFPQEGRNDYTGIVRQVGTIGGKPLIKVETPNLDGWYVTFSSDNEKMLTVDEDGYCDIIRGGTVYVTVTYTNGVDKVTDIVSWYNHHWNRDIELYFRGEGMDPPGDYMRSSWEFSLGTPVALEPLLVFPTGEFRDVIIRSVDIVDESVLTYENGVLTPVSAGTTDIEIDCSWRGYTSSSWTGSSSHGGTGSADLHRKITVTVS